jgi:DNA polymerase I-like protein with 3'-5' exonuclease and polymerase domains
MNLDKVYVCDIEAIGYLPEIKTFEDLHVLSCSYKKDDSWNIVSTKAKKDIEKLVSNPDNTLVFHNGFSFDKPALEKMGIEFNAELIDTLALSYYLYSEKQKHGLGEWGEYFGVPKPKIEDWKGLSFEEYKNRCEEDVKINTNLWTMMLEFLRTLYNNDEEIVRVIKYLNHKANMIYLQDKNPIRIDLPKAKENLIYLEAIIDEKTEELSSIMPKVPNKVKRTKPKNCFKKDGDLSKAGERWFSYLHLANLDSEYDGVVEEVVSWDEPNPQSTKQMKSFLFDKGWKPKLFKDGANGRVPQLRDDDKNLCGSIINLIEDYPELKSLDGLSVAQHRSGYLKSMISAASATGSAPAWAHGFTRTLRLKHVAPFVNLPKPNSDHGNLVRSVMIAPEGYVCIGADLSSIEDKCKQISIFPYDPEYVKSMNVVGWDAHLNLGQKAGFFTPDEVQFYKWFKSKDKTVIIGECPDSFLGLSDKQQHEAFESLDKKRAISKTGTYSLTYGAGAAKVGEAANIPLKESKSLHKGYWDINWSVKKFAEDRITKDVRGLTWIRKHKKAGGLTTVNNSTWIWNEHSNLWLFLKNDKDRFSACNQNFAVKVFDIWGYFLMEEGIEPSFQSHDEYLWYCREEDVEAHKLIIDRSVVKLNNYFKPPIPLEIDYKVGKTYAEVH